jgi:hypothetical protein
VNRNPLTYRTSWVLAGIRIAMIALFATWVMVGAPGPVRDHSLIAVLAAYSLFAFAVLYCALRSWWLDYHLARPSLLIDTAAFWAALIFTQRVGFDVFSPFITFFAFLVISAGSRWHQKYMPGAAIGLGVTFALGSLLLYGIGAPVNLEKLPRRFSYLLVLAILLGWFATMRGTPGRTIRHKPELGKTPSRQDRALALAIAASGAKGVALIWTADDEPRGKVLGAGTHDADQVELPPGLVEEPECIPPMLFDRKRSRRLVPESDNKVASQTGPFRGGLVDYLGIAEGLSVPLVGSMGSGQLVLTGLAAMCWDDIWLGVWSQHVMAGFDDKGIGL